MCGGRNCRSHAKHTGKWTINFAFFMKNYYLLVGGTETPRFSPLLSLPPSLSRNLKAPQQIFGSLLGFAAPQFAPARLAFFPQHGQFSHLDCFFGIIWVLAGRRKHLVPQAQRESTSRCLGTAEISAEMSKPSCALVLFRSK